MFVWCLFCFVLFCFVLFYFSHCLIYLLLGATKYHESYLHVYFLDTSDGQSSGDPCDDLYHGSAPFSEPEVAALRDFVTSLGGGDEIAIYMDYHSYGQFWMTPYGYKDEIPIDNEKQVR